MNIVNAILIAIILLLAGYCAKLKMRRQVPDTNLAEQKGMELLVSNNDVMQYVRDTASYFVALMESRKISFDVKCSPESMMGWIDTEKIDKMLLLILSDMIKTPAQGGRIILNAYTNTQYDQVTIRISNNGEQLKGMGLFIVHQLAHQHHGTLRAEYYEGQGNTVVIELPIKKDAYQTEQADGGQTPTFHIPTNIELHVPSIELPTGYDEQDKPLGAIVQQAYMTADQEYLKRAIQCINDHMSDTDYSREDFAADMGSSVSTLYNKIRALTGKSVTNFSRDIRIKTACRLAKEHPELRVSDIAYQVGFKDPKYFATSFKRVTGLQPKEYINRQKSAGR